MRISTVIPAYNRADLIGATIDSILNQSRPPDEVIVVDDGSTDGTPDVIAGYGRAVRLLRQTNGGAGSARNRGFVTATGTIVHFMDSDDIASPNFYAVGAAAIERGADFTYGPLLNVRFVGQDAFPADYVLQQHALPADEAPSTKVLAFEWVTVFQPCLVRREVAERAGPYRTDLAPSEDREFLYRVLREAQFLAHTPETLILYRVHPESQISAENDPRRLVDLARLVEIFEAEINRRPDLDQSVRRRFIEHKASLIVALGDTCPDVVERLMCGSNVPGALQLILHRAASSSLFRRLHGKWRRATTGSCYPQAYGGGRTTNEQLCVIERMGYRLQLENAGSN